MALLAPLAAGAEPFEFPDRAAVGKAGELLGTPVQTRDGADLGRVQDLAVDLDSGRLAYIVISVGSFLIEDSLIAVDPTALRRSRDADSLILEADAETLRDARRFSNDFWPLAADVTGTPRPAGDDTLEAGAAPSTPSLPTTNDRGRATISDGRRTATLSAGMRRMELLEQDEPAAPASSTDEESAQPPDAAAPERRTPETLFQRLDRDGDGVLNRAEIAHELSRDDRFADIDSDGDGFIDEQEFDAWRAAGDQPESASKPDE
jgi:sporulation protein YlmC with PRC-barrel domain